MADFEAKITGIADLSKAKQDFLNFKQQAEKPIKLTFDANGLNAIFTGLGKQAQQAGAQVGQQLVNGIQNDIKNVKVNLPLERLFKQSGSTSIASHLGIDVKTAQALKNELKDINAEGAVLSKLTIGNNGNSFEAIVKNANTTITVLGKLEETENQLGIKTSRWITTSQRYTTDFTNSLKQAQKESQLLSDKLKNIGDTFSTGGFDKQVAKIKSDLANIGTGVNPSDTKRVSDAALEYLGIVREIQGSLNGTAQNPLQGQDLANRYNDAEMALKSYNNAMEILKSNAKSFGIETGDAIKQAQNEAKRAAQEAQAEANKLAQAIQKVNDAFDSGKVDLERSKIQSAFSNVGQDVSQVDIKKAADAANEYLQIIRMIEDSRNGKSANPLQGQDLVDAYDMALSSLEKYKNAMAELGANAKAMGVDTGNAVKQSIQEAEAAARKAQQEADKLAQGAEKVARAYNADEFTKNTDMMSKQLSEISNTVPDALVQKAQQAADEYKRITDEIVASQTGKNPLTDAQTIAKYDEAKEALRRYKNVMDEVKYATQDMFDAGANIRAANKIDEWAKKNSRALGKYGEKLDEIKQKMLALDPTDKGGLKDLTNELKNIDSEASALGLKGLSLGDQIKNSFSRIAQFTGIYAFTSKVRQAIMEIPKEVVKIDTAMTELRKVSTASANEISNYFDTAADSAYKYGQAIDEVINATASWTRLGYNLKDASILTDVTAELAQVGSGLDTKSATEGLQATIRGFGLMAEDAKYVGDVINEVADTQPIDASGVINGLERSSAAMREANNSLEETIGLITASTSVTQDATAAGTAWRVIAMRIRGKILCHHTGKVCMQCCA